MALLQTLVDDFPGSSFDPVQWPTVPANFTVTGGVASVTPTVSGLVFIESGVYDATGSYLIVKVTVPPSTGSPTTEAYIWLDANNYVRIFQQSASLTFYGSDAGVGFATSITNAYDPATHAYWRLRYASGTFYASASANGWEWTTEKTQAVSFAVTAVTARLGLNRGGAAGITATFDKVNLPEAGCRPNEITVAVASDNPTIGIFGPDGVANAIALANPAATYKTELLFEDFAGTRDAVKWPTATTGATFSGGVLNLSTASTFGSTVNLQSAGVWDFTDSYVYAQVTPYSPTVVDGHQTRMVVLLSGTNQVAMYTVGNVMYYSITNTGVETSTSLGTYNATNHAWWRIRHSSATGQAFFATSADGVTWTNDAATATTVAWATTPVFVRLGAYRNVVGDASGTSTYDNVNGGAPGPTTATPDGINDVDALDAPTASFDSDPASPDGINDGVASDDPAVAETDSATPDGIGDAVGSDNPAVVPNDTEAGPDGIGDPVASDDPVVTFGDLALPDEGPQLDVVSDNPAVTETDAATPDGIAVAVTSDNPAGAFAQTINPDDAGNLAVTSDNPTATNTQIATPTSNADAINSDNPSAAFVQAAALTDGVAITVAADDPTVARSVLPDGIAVAVTSDNPVGLAATAAALTDGVALAVAQDNPSTAAKVFPDGIAVSVNQDAPAPAFIAAPAGVAVPVALDNPTLTQQFRATPDGLFVHQHTQAPESVSYPDPVLTPSPIYTRLVPRTPYQDPAAVTAAHFLGIGPWYVEAIWGSINHGVRPRARGVSTPLLPLPGAVAKSFTLRLNAGDEGRTDFELPRDQAFLVERMATDLWWRRRDPHRAVLEPIGRFNAQTVDISMADTGKVKISCTWIDHRSLLEDRLIINYLDVVNQETQWAAATLCTTILQFVIPANSQLDLTEIFDAPAAIGTTRYAFEALPGSTVGDIMDNLSAASTVKFEWYVEMPAVDTDRPKLRLIPGTRGSDNGVILHEIGVGESPIASWAIQAAGEKYANAVMYSDSAGGAAIETMPADVKKYGEHDAHVTDSSLKDGVLTALKDAAAKKVAELSSQQITWTLRLRAGFWEGRGHIDVGDWVTVRIALGGELITGKYRVTEISVDIDELGVEDVSLTFGPPRPAKDPRSRYASQARFVRTLKASTPKGIPPPDVHTM